MVHKCNITRSTPETPEEQKKSVTLEGSESKKGLWSSVHPDLRAPWLLWKGSLCEVSQWWFFCRRKDFCPRHREHKAGAMAAAPGTQLAAKKVLTSVREQTGRGQIKLFKKTKQNSKIMQTADRCVIITLTQRTLLRPAQVVSGQQEAEREAPSSCPSKPAVTTPVAPQGPNIQAAVCHHSHSQNAASCRQSKKKKLSHLSEEEEAWITISGSKPTIAVKLLSNGNEVKLLHRRINLSCI